MDDLRVPPHMETKWGTKKHHIFWQEHAHTHRLLGDDNDYLRQQFDQETLEFGHKSRLKQNVEQKI